ncbi:hypothetical protein N015_13155 [Pseudomonas asturiensis]|uniref:Uncharacterized protein n=1 Tax=Pseudomonas asturiensis TaxID=1190415 RepID=A0ABX6HCS5_9PSED|nr:hypothetical protein [Pseudomonas asturiensis]QHF03302.1 hypothetical protein N015_13155 [Pseudomonas asturiensis]
MPKFMLDYIRLCRECSLDLRTIGNMRSIVIPSLQREAAAIRAAVQDIAGAFPELERDAEMLESAVRAGLQRCQPEPIQQSLFAERPNDLLMPLL